MDSRARHHLPLEGIAMQIDDARKYQEIAGIDRAGRTFDSAAESDDGAVCDRERGLDNLFAEQRPAAWNENILHDTALLRGLVNWKAEEAASYLSRNASIASFLKSGKAA